METQMLAFHESMEVHELVNFKTICLAKSKLMQGLVFDPDLKELMQQDVQQSMKQLNQLTTHYERAPIQSI